MRFYIFKNNSDGTVEAILDHDTSFNTAWGNQTIGPKTALIKLKKDTNGWKGLNFRKDSYSYSTSLIGYSK